MDYNETNSPESFTLLHANITEADAKNLEPAKIEKNKKAWGQIGVTTKKEIVPFYLPLKMFRIGFSVQMRFLKYFLGTDFLCSITLSINPSLLLGPEKVDIWGCPAN